MRSLTLTAALAAAVLGAPALAQPLSQAPSLKGELRGFSGNPAALPDAIRALESATGGQIVEIRYSGAQGAPGFQAAVAKGSVVTLMRVTTPHPNVTTISTETAPVWLLKWRGRTDVRLAQKAKVPLADAVRKAEATEPGAAAVAAGIATSASNPTSDVHAYNVLLARGDDVQRVAIDSETGAVIANPRALANWP